jgi:hypothetical protein
MTIAAGVANALPRNMNSMLESMSATSYYSVFPANTSIIKGTSAELTKNIQESRSATLLN